MSSPPFAVGTGLSGQEWQACGDKVIFDGDEAAPTRRRYVNGSRGMRAVYSNGSLIRQGQDVMRGRSNSRPRGWVDQDIKKRRTNRCVGLWEMGDASGRGHKEPFGEGGMIGGTRYMGGVNQLLNLGVEEVSKYHRGSWYGTRAVLWSLGK